ncbi:STAS domain-containing protein [Actinoplanes sp. NPDC000266]
MTTFALPARLTRTDISLLCRKIGFAPGEVVVDVSTVAEPSVITVEALARLKLAARRHGRRLRVHGASSRLRELMSLLGLEGVLMEEAARKGQTGQEGEGGRGGEEGRQGEEG